MSHVTGKFNARLEACLFLHIQEGVWAGNRDGESVLKYLITSEQVEIERKGMDSYGLPSFLRLFMSANADWVVPASPDERRFAVFEASDAKKGDGSYFRALRQEMNSGGPAALLHMLQTYDLRDFEVRRPPASVGLRKQKLESLRVSTSGGLKRSSMGHWMLTITPGVRHHSPCHVSCYALLMRVGPLSTALREIPLSQASLGRGFTK
jgi:hypothetical protein